MKKYSLLLLAILSGILTALAWPENGFPGLLFVSFIPLLFVHDMLNVSQARHVRFSPMGYSYISFFTWNILTTWWIYNSTLIGALMAVILNSLFLATVFQAASWSGRKTGNRLAGYIALITFWLAFEYLHLNWILTWPWLNLGNGFAARHTWVQWYEFTGTAGGTLWILTVNILFYEALRPYLSPLRSKRNRDHNLRGRRGLLPLIVAILLIILPILVSRAIYSRYQEKQDPVNFVIVQPNVDPYNEQYNLPPTEVIGRIMELAEPLLDSATNFLVAPESAIQENMWENDLSSFQSLVLLRQVIMGHPGLNIIIGGSTFYEYLPGEEISRTARPYRKSSGFYDAYNTAILLNAADSLQLYHKSKLTPGVEALPSFRGFKWFEQFALDLGGTVGSLGTDTWRKVYTPLSACPVSAAICYESVFGEFFAEFVRNGAGIMVIITNDGWWGDTPGYKQHFAFSRLRAIETRRSIARSANTGISAFIDQRGDAHQMTGYWVPAAIKGTLNASQELTFYVRHGDFISRIAVWFTLAILFITILFAIFARKRSLADRS